MSRHLLLSRVRCGLLLPLLLPLPAKAVDLDRDPINYTTTQPHNAVERLQERLDHGQAKLRFEEGPGYLRSLLRELDVPVSSQMLVFSKTSLQRQRINQRLRFETPSLCLSLQLRHLFGGVRGAAGPGEGSNHAAVVGSAQR